MNYPVAKALIGVLTLLAITQAATFNGNRKSNSTHFKTAESETPVSDSPASVLSPSSNDSADQSTPAGKSPTGIPDILNGIGKEPHTSAQNAAFPNFVSPPSGLHLGGGPGVGPASFQRSQGGYDYPAVGGLPFGAPLDAGLPPPVGVPPVGPGLVGLPPPVIGTGVAAVGYLPIVEKVIALVGLGILILVVIAVIHGSLAAGGLLHSFASGFSTGFSKSVSASEKVSGPGFREDVALNGRVGEAVSRNF